MVLSPVALKLHLDGQTYTAVITDVADLAVLSWGIYDHWNMKKVPEKAVVTTPKENVT